MTGFGGLVADQPGVAWYFLGTSSYPHIITSHGFIPILYKNLFQSCIFNLV